MKTKIVRLDENNIDFEELKIAGNIIKEGGLVAFPTETVYGLGGDAFNSESSMKIYKAKGRPSDNPLIVHISNIEDIKKVAIDIPDIAYKVLDKFWPGPLTVILKKVPDLPKETTGGLDTVAVRMPVNIIAREFIKCAGGFVAAPSANISGRPSPTVAKYVIEDLDGRVDMIIDGGDSDIGLESTIIDLSVKNPVILRPGYITQDDLLSVIEAVDIDKTIIEGNSNIAPKAPGMKYRHYAPKGELTIVHGKSDDVVAYINLKTKEAKHNDLKTGIIATSSNVEYYDADIIKDIGPKEDEALIAKNLFRILREFDEESVDVIYTEGFNTKGLSLATMNRLLKAAGHKEVYL